MDQLAQGIQAHLDDVARNPNVHFDQSLLGSLDQNLSGTSLI